MKNTGKCPKCDAEDVIRVIKDKSFTNWIRLGFMRFARAALYVCGRCGYVEEWVEDPVQLREIRAKFGKSQ